MYVSVHDIEILAIACSYQRQLLLTGHRNSNRVLEKDSKVFTNIYGNSFLHKKPMFSFNLLNNSDM